MFVKSKRLGLLILIMAVLVFMGINFLKAGKPQQWEWSVDIPAPEEWSLYACDADGIPYLNGRTFEDEGLIFVRVKKYKGGREVTYSFRLWIKNDTPTHDQKIRFQKLNLTNNEDLETSGECPCSFPPDGPCPDVSEDEIPECMQSFLENQAHPYTDPDPSSDKDYKEFWLSVDVDCDIESMSSGSSARPSGNIYIQTTETDSGLPEGEGLHTVVAGRDVAEGGIIKITRGDENPNSWEIIVEDIGTMRFTEAYWAYWGTGKGKFKTMKPIRAISPFKFKATWKR